MSGVTGDRFGQWFWCTITAPGVELLPWDEDECTHDEGVPCSGALGCQVDSFRGAVWNGSAPKRWSWVVTYLRRKLRQDVQYCGVWEFQERGVLHRHFLIRCERPVSQKRVAAAVRSSARAFGFGQRFDVQAITGDAAQQAWYVASYSTKTVDQIQGRRLIDPRTGEVKRTNGFRPWSASKRWGDSMKVVKQRQCAWARAAGVSGAARSPAAGPGDGAAGALDDNSRSSTVDVVEGVGAFIVSAVDALL